MPGPVSMAAYLLARQPGPLLARPQALPDPPPERVPSGADFRPGLRVTVGNGRGGEREAVARWSDDGAIVITST